MFKKWLRARFSPFDLAPGACLFNLVSFLSVSNSVKFSRDFVFFAEFSEIMSCLKQYLSPSGFAVAGYSL